MNTPGESLILGNGTQLDLMPGDELDLAGLPAEAYADAEARGRFTGERLFLQNPKLYGAVAKLLARGETYREIADLCQVSTQTVTGVAYREAIPVETLRERLGRIGFDVARLSMEAMLELLSDPIARMKISAKDLSVIYGIAVSNSQLLLGGATARIESRDVMEPGHADYLRMLADAQAAARRGEINVTPTGLRAENPGAKEGGVIALAVPTSGLDRADQTGASGVEIERQSPAAD